MVLEGADGTMRGTLRLGEATVDFQRAGRRAEYEGGRYETVRSAVAFSLSSPHPAVAARCAMRERRAALTAGLSVATTPLEYACHFSGAGVEPDDELVLGLLDPNGGADGLAERRTGRVTLGGRTLTIDSLHALRGVGVGSGTPLGYVLRDGTRSVGAVDRTGARPVLVAASDLPPDVRTAMEVAGVALALLIGPEDLG